MPFVLSSFLVLVRMLLVAMPGAPSSFLYLLVVTACGCFNKENIVTPPTCPFSWGVDVCFAKWTNHEAFDYNHSDDPRFFGPCKFGGNVGEWRSLLQGTRTERDATCPRSGWNLYLIGILRVQEPSMFLLPTHLSILKAFFWSNRLGMDFQR